MEKNKIELISIIIFILLTYSLNAQSKWALGVTGGPVFPLNDFNDLYNVGYSGNTQITYLWSENGLLTFSVGFTRWTVENDAVNKAASEAGLQAQFNLDSYLQVIPVLIGVKWYFTNGNYRPYILLEGGIYNFTLKIRGTVTSLKPGDDNTPVIISESTDSGSETALALGLGYFEKLNENLYLELTGKYNFITNAKVAAAPNDIPTINGVTRSIKYLTILAGINYRF